MALDRLKNRERFSTTIDPKMLSQLKKYANETRIPISKLMDEAVTLLVVSDSNKNDKNILAALRDEIAGMMQRHNLVVEESVVGDYEVGITEGYNNGYLSALSIVLDEIEAILELE